ncbi:MAG TPA: aspartyl-phosphate phosphatase Spo0E family protein [Epulopiscium sp.]|nr:aspartyl-phosphate phosphatase Spo0E family protein [Candidatus Epulonipiscium sp.]
MPYGQNADELKEKIEQVRKRLNHLIDLEESKISTTEVLKLSQELDDLLVEYQRS